MFNLTSPLLAWLLVMVSGALEVVFSIAMKFSDGYTRPVYSAVSIVAAISSVWLVSITLRVLPIGTAYAVWAGIGAAGTALVGIVWLGEPASMLRIVSIAVIIAGVVGLQLQG